MKINLSTMRDAAAKDNEDKLNQLEQTLNVEGGHILAQVEELVKKAVKDLESSSNDTDASQQLLQGNKVLGVLQAIGTTVRGETSTTQAKPQLSNKEQTLLNDLRNGRVVLTNDGFWVDRERPKPETTQEKKERKREAQVPREQAASVSEPSSDTTPITQPRLATHNGFRKRAQAKLEKFRKPEKSK